MSVAPSPQYCLALHTTTPDLGLAIDTLESPSPQAGETSGRTQVLNLGREMAATLHFHLQTFLAPQTWGDLACIAVAKGPGGFTGTRLGVVTARTLAQQLNIPLFALSTLETLAFDQSQRAIDSLEHPTPLLALSLPAQRGQYFCGIYHCHPQDPPTAIVPDQVLEMDRWQSLLDQYQPDRLWNLTAQDPIAPSVSALLRLAQRYWRLPDPNLSRPHWLQALPFYGQDPVILKTSVD